MKDSNLENFDILDSIDLSVLNIDNQEKSSIDDNNLFEQNIELNKNSETLVENNNNIELLETSLDEELANEIENIKNEEKNNILENTNVNLKKKNNPIINGMLFLTKYILTSSLIFGVLLVSTNYSAYLNVVKSYVFKGELQSKEQKLITSVEAANIKEKYAGEKLKEIKNQDENEDSQLSIKKMKKEQDKENIDLNIDITPYENRIVIPKIGKNVPLLDIKNRQVDGQKELNNIFMKELERGVIRYPGSAKPGQEGNTFMFGHSSNYPWAKGDYNDVFALLDKVSNNDEIIVYYGQEKFTYRIKEKRVIKPGDVSVLEKSSKKSEITLMTCWPVGTTLNRLIVTGELVKR